MSAPVKTWITKYLFLSMVLTLGLALTVMVIVFIGAPLVNYVVDGIPYTVLSWEKIKRILLLTPLLGFFIALVLSFRGWRL
jgi:hypothetical protein